MGIKAVTDQKEETCEESQNNCSELSDDDMSKAEESVLKESYSAKSRYVKDLGSKTPPHMTSTDSVLDVEVTVLNSILKAYFLNFMSVYFKGISIVIDWDKFTSKADEYRNLTSAADVERFIKSKVSNPQVFMENDQLANKRLKAVDRKNKIEQMQYIEKKEEKL